MMSKHRNEKDKSNYEDAWWENMDLDSLRRYPGEGDGRGSSLTGAELERIRSLSLPLSQADELEIIKSFGLKVKVISKGAYKVVSQEEPIHEFDLQAMLQDSLLAVSVNGDSSKREIYGIFTDCSTECSSACIREIRKEHNDDVCYVPYNAKYYKISI